METSLARIKGIKALWALFLGIILVAFLALGMVSYPGGGYSLLFSLRTSGLFLLCAIPIVAAALATGMLLRPRRPERVAVIGALAVFVALLVGIRGFADWPDAHPLSLGLYIFAPFAASVWVGANYWRFASLPPFWRGPGGALLKGGFAGALVAFPMRLYAWYHFEHMASQYFTPRPFNWSPGILVALGAVSTAALITALLLSWKPRPLLGAFAGSGLALLYWTAMFLPLILRDRDIPQLLALRWPEIIAYLLMGAVAGIFAGRWRLPTGADEI